MKVIVKNPPTEEQIEKLIQKIEKLVAEEN